jgi:DNA-binding IclR family transcriptional regulator
LNAEQQNLIFQGHAKRLLIFLKQNRGTFVPVCDMAEHLGLSLNTTIDILVLLQTKGLARQTVGGWKA